MTEPHIANHATHFLRRLDRVTGEQLELAMSLYTGADLVAEVLKRAQLPDAAERVAISLGSRHDGPFVVVTRAGRFVTCLGEGMRPRELAVITRPELETAARDVERMRERLDRIRRLEAESEDSLALKRLRAIDLTAPILPREDFRELARWDPLLGSAWHNEFFACSDAFRQSFSILERLRPGLHDRLRLELLEGWWTLFWAASNLHVLANVGEVHTRCAQIDDAQNDPDHGAALLVSLVPGFGLPFVQSGARAIWAAMQHPMVVLPILEPAVAARPFERVLRDTCLTAIATGSRCGRERASKALAHPPLREASSYDARWDAETAPILRDAVRDPEAALDAFTYAARERVAHERGLDARDVPDDVARALALAGGGDFVADAKLRNLLAGAAPWLAAADASELFVPRAFVRPIAFTPARARSLVSSISSLQRIVRTPVRAQPTIERNASCPCGSARKYKHCCLRVARAA